MTDPRISPENAARADQRVLKLGTRGSPLALAQARQMAAALEVMSGGEFRGEIVTFTTTGDQLTTERLINSGGKGLFTKELDAAVDAGIVDFAVHSLKDVPTKLPPGQIFVCMPEREDVREGFLCTKADHPRDLSEGAVVGTASLRREAQTLNLRPDLKIKTFRGNVATRMRKLEDGEADATYLAMAGLTRLGLAGQATPIPVEDMLPSAAQGIIGVTAKEGALPESALDAFRQMTDGYAWAAATAERSFLEALDGSCRTPIAAHLFKTDDGYRLEGEVLSVDGQQKWTAQGTAPPGADTAVFAALGRALGDQIREEAGGDLPAFNDD